MLIVATKTAVIRINTYAYKENTREMIPFEMTNDFTTKKTKEKQFIIDFSKAHVRDFYEKTLNFSLVLF